MGMELCVGEAEADLEGRNQDLHLDVVAPFNVSQRLGIFAQSLALKGRVIAFAPSSSADGKTVLIAFIGRGELSLVLVLALKAEYETFMPTLVGRTMLFESENAILDYIDSSQYSKENPGLGAAIIVYSAGTNAAGQRGWEYAIRMNMTGKH